MKITRFRVIIAAAAALTPVLAACGPPNSSGVALEQGQNQNIQRTYELNEPAPTFQYSQYRATGISIEAIQALGIQTTSFGFNQGIRNPIWSCPSLGEPFPNTAEITNPQQNYNASFPNGGTSYPIGNMDPNGVYTPAASTGTYVLCVDRNGVPYAQYWEGFVDTVSGPAAWDAATGTIVVTGAPTMPKCTVANAGTKNAKTTCVK